MSICVGLNWMKERKVKNSRELLRLDNKFDNKMSRLS